MSGVSVVIPSYNASQFLRATLASVFAQTRLPDEVIVVDDASTDNTRAIVRQIAAEAPVPLRLLEMPKNTGGPAMPINAGVEAAAAEWIALLDHDDIMLPDKIAAQTAVLAQHPDVELVLSDCKMLTGVDLQQPRASLPWLDDKCRTVNDPAPALHILDAFTCQLELMKSTRLAPSCSSYVFQKSLWSRLLGFRADAGICADYDFLLRAADRPVAWLARALFWKRQHGGNLWQPNLQNTLLAIRIRERWLCEAESIFGEEQCRLLRRESVGATVDAALELYLEGRLDEFEQLRRPLRALDEVPLVAGLLDFNPRPRGRSAARHWADTVRVALRKGPLRAALARAYRSKGWQFRYAGQFLRATGAFAHAVALSPRNKYYWRWLVGSILRRSS